jgi:hypothetical protein
MSEEEGAYGCKMVDYFQVAQGQFIRLFRCKDCSSLVEADYASDHWHWHKRLQGEVKCVS